MRSGWIAATRAGCALVAAGMCHVADPAAASPKHPAHTASANPYAMHDVRLGITLAEFNAIPIPTDGKYVDASLSCEDAPKVSDSIPASTVCEWEGVYKPSASPALRQADRIEVTYGLSFAYPKFWFTKDEGGTPRLYQITLIANVDKWQLIYPSMTEKFGKPQVRQFSVQNRLGASFPAMTAAWSNGVSTLLAEKTCNGDLEAMCVTYTHTALNQQMGSNLKASF